MDSLTIDIVDDSAGFRQLCDEWRELAAGVPNATPFSSWAWLYTWWDNYAHPGDQPLVLLCRQAGQLVALLPLQIQRRGPLGMLRELRFLGTGEAEHEEVLSEYLDLMCLPGYEARVLPALLETLQQLRGRWHCSLFSDLLPEALLGRLVAQWQPPSRRIAWQRGVRYRIGLPEDFDAYLASLSASTRYKIRRSERRIAACGGVTHRRADQPESLDKAFGTLVGLHRQRWGQGGLFDQQRFARFHHSICQRLLEDADCQPLIDLYLLDDQPLAALYSFRQRGTHYYYQSGFSSDHARYSPLLLAHMAAIRSAIDDGYQHYDLMRGGLDSYKASYGAEQTPMRYLACYPGPMASLQHRMARRLMRHRPAWNTAKLLHSPERSVRGGVQA